MLPAAVHPRLRQLFWAIALSVYFIAIYSTTNLLASQQPAVPSVYFAWERHMPFVPAMIVPYMSIDLFFFFAPFLCAERRQMRVHAMRIIFAVTVAGIIFFVAPLKYGFERPRVEGMFAPIFTLLWSADLPFNLAPSLHLALRTILWPVYVRRTRGTLRLCVKIWFLAIGISTLLVHQHHLIDVVSGVALGMMALYVFDERIEAGKSRRVFPKIAARYFLGAAICISIAVITAPWGAIALWPALALTLVGVAYCGVGVRVFRKLSDGRMMTAAKWILEPYLLGQKLYAWFHTRGQPAYVALTDRIFIGRRLSVREARRFASEHQPACVVDLAAEFQERPSLRAVARYVCVPMLDLVPPTQAQLAAAVEAIRAGEQRAVIYVHCSMGRFRTALVASAYLVSTGSSVDEAMQRIRHICPQAVIKEFPTCASSVNGNAQTVDRALAATNP
jgi:hypothetical protein